MIYNKSKGSFLGVSSTFFNQRVRKRAAITSMVLFTITALALVFASFGDISKMSKNICLGTSLISFSLDLAALLLFFWQDGRQPIPTVRNEAANLDFPEMPTRPKPVKSPHEIARKYLKKKKYTIHVTQSIYHSDYEERIRFFSKKALEEASPNSYAIHEIRLTDIKVSDYFILIVGRGDSQLVYHREEEPRLTKNSQAAAQNWLWESRESLKDKLPSIS